MMKPYVIHFAPLQGYTDSVYREAHAQVFGGVETYYTPFVRLEENGFRNKELRDLTPETNTFASLVPQMIAASPQEFRRIAGLFRESGYLRADINLGCPFPMQARQHRGAGILPYPDEVKALLETIFEFPEIQFSVKLRLGWNSPDEAQALLPFLNKLPLVHLSLHPRIGTQQYKGETNRDAFSRFYDSCTLPLLYNGDIRTLSDIRSLTGHFPRLKGIMLGRGLLSFPWLAMEHVSGTSLTAGEKKEKLSAFHALLVAGYSSRLEGGEHQVLDKMKAIWDYLLPDAEKRLRKKVLKSSCLADYLEAVRNLIYHIPVTTGR